MVALVATSATVAWADAFTDFQKARNSYSAGRYEEAAQRFAVLLDPANGETVTDPVLLEQTRTYYAASLIALGRQQQADKEIEAILMANPAYSPDPIFPTVVLDRFTEVRARMRAELERRALERAQEERREQERQEQARRREAERIARITQLAKQEYRVQENSRWIAAIPFGVGQFQNDQQALGWLFLTTEAALAATSIVTGAIVSSLQTQGIEALTPGPTRRNIDVPELNSRIDTAQTINHISLAALVVVAVGGVAHAQLTFVPERVEVRERELPAGLRPTAHVGVKEQGAFLGLTGHF